MSERSERVGRPSDAPQTFGLAAGVRRGASHNHPSGGPAGSVRSSSGDSRGTRMVRVEPPTDDVARRVIRPRRTSLARLVVGGSRWRADRSVGGSAVLRCWSRRAGGSYGGVAVVARENDRSEGRVSGARDGGQGAHCARSTATPPPDEETASDSTILLCCSGSRSPAAVASLHRQAPTLLRRCGAGLAHTSITGADVGDLCRCSVDVGDLGRCSVDAGDLRRCTSQAARRAVGRRPASRCASLSPWAA